MKAADSYKEKLDMLNGNMEGQNPKATKRRKMYLRKEETEKVLQVEKASKVKRRGKQQG